MTKERILTMVKQYINSNDLRTLNELVSGLESDIRDENNKKRGTGNLAKAMKDCMKVNTYRSDFQKAWIHNGRTVVTNGYYMIMSGAEVELPMNEKAPINIEPWIDGYYSTNYEVVKTPTMADVKTKIALDKSEGLTNLYYTIEREDGRLITLDAKYLLTMLMATPDAVITASRDNVNSPIYFNSPADLTFGMLCPIRVK